MLYGRCGLDLAVLSEVSLATRAVYHFFRAGAPTCPLSHSLCLPRSLQADGTFVSGLPRSPAGCWLACLEPSLVEPAPPGLPGQGMPAAAAAIAEQSGLEGNHSPNRELGRLRASSLALLLATTGGGTDAESGGWLGQW